MARSQPGELLILDRILTAQRTIGVAAPISDWLVTAAALAITEGIPPLDFQQMPKTPRFQLFTQYVGTVPNPDADAMPGIHGMRERFVTWCVVRQDVTQAGYRDLIRLKSDVLRSMFSAEGDLQTLATYGVWPGIFTPHEEMLLFENWVGVQEFFADVGMTHANP